MQKLLPVALTATLLALVVPPAVAADSDAAPGSRFGVSVLAGLHAVNQNDTSMPDYFVNVPGVAALTFHATRVVAVDAELTWMIPVRQKVDLSTGVSEDRKMPQMLAYQANVRAIWPLTHVAPYVTAGAGAATFLSDSGTDRLPDVTETQTMFATNFGAGVDYAVAPRWVVRADFRELVAFPSEDAAGLSSSGSADPIWMERGTLGLGYQF